MAFNDVWGSVWDGVGDFFSDSDTYKNLIAELIKSDPKIKTGKMKEILQMQQPFNFQNISTPLGQSETTFDPETGQPTTVRSIPQSSLNFLNSKMKQVSEGGWNDYDAPQGFKDYGTGLLNARQLASGTGGVDLMDFTDPASGQVDMQGVADAIGANWWETPEGDTFDFVPYSNFWDSGGPSGGGTDPITGMPSGGSNDPNGGPTGSEGGETRDREGIQPTDELYRGNEEQWDRWLNDPNNLFTGPNATPGQFPGMDAAIQDFLESGNPGAIQSWLLENSDNIGGGLDTAIDIIMGIPVIGDMVEAAIERWGDEYWMTNEWASPNPAPGDIPNSELDDQIDDYIGDEDLPNSPVDEVPPPEGHTGPWNGSTGTGTGGQRTPGSRIRSYYINGRRVTKAEYEAYVKGK